MLERTIERNRDTEDEILIKRNTKIFIEDFRELVKKRKQEAVHSLLKFMANSVQCELATKCYYNDKDQNAEHMSAILGSFRLDLTFEDEEECEEKILVRTTPIIACVWNHLSMVETLETIGECNGNPFDGIRYRRNITSLLIKPLGLVLVDNGNHSTNAAIVYGEGEIMVNAMLDITPVLKKYRFDGIHYIEIDTNEIARVPLLMNGCKPFSYTIGLLYEMARVLQEEKMRIV